MPLVPTYIYRAKYLTDAKSLISNDGDTWWFDLDLGLRNHQFTKVRLHGYGAEERTTPAGMAARAAAHMILSLAQVIVIQTHKTREGTDRASHDRWVGDIEIDGHPLWQLLGVHVHPEAS